jgi:hypothetical protein
MKGFMRFLCATFFNMLVLVASQTAPPLDMNMPLSLEWFCICVGLAGITVTWTI